MQGRNIFQGGFLGLDNIGLFDRSARLPTGGFISQCDGTSWMWMYSLNLMRIALELAATNPTCSTNISTAILAAGSAPPIRPDGPGWWRL